jgi:outer membrane protein insertion porin family/translocation and assembly module TamA
MRPISPFLGSCVLVLALAASTAACSSLPEGRSAVDSVTIVNAHSLDADDVKGKLSTEATPRFLGLWQGLLYDYEVFDASVLQRDLARVERTYRGHGFLEAHARAARVIRLNDRHVRVEIVVDEGPPTLNRELRVDGLESLPPEIASEARNAAAQALPRGTRFDEEAYAKARTAVARALTDHGYAYAAVQTDAQADLAAHSIDYVFSVKPGLAAVFGAITIVDAQATAQGGAPPFEEAALRRALDITPGQPYSTAEIDAATQALLDLEVLSAVQIVPQLADPPAPVVPLTVRIEVAKLHEWRLGGGIEFDEIKTDLHGLVGWEDHDFLGDLRDFSVDFKPGVVLYPMRVNNIVVPENPLPEERLRFELRQPGFLEARTTASFRPEMNVFPMLITPNPPSGAPVLGYAEPKESVALDHRFGKHLLVRASHSVQGEIPFQYTTIGLAQIPPGVVLSFLQLVTTLDYRDDPVHPREGFYLSNDLQVAGGPIFGGAPILGGSASDVRVQPEARGYVPIAKGVTLAARGSVGFLFAYNYGDYVQNHLAQDLNPNPNSHDYLYNRVDRDIEIAYFRGFFSGGPSSNRGFPLRGIAPHGVVPFLSPVTLQSQYTAGGLTCIPGQPTYDASKCAVPIGGFTLWEGSIETRFDVSGPLGAVLFCDAGDVAAGQGTIRLDHLHLSCGAGARYDTPVGPLRLDVGYRIQPLQVLGFQSEGDALNADRLEGSQPLLFGLPLAVSFSIGETY